jgi:hypothetical protein
MRPDPNPVPEPSTLGLGLAGPVAARRLSALREI